MFGCGGLFALVSYLRGGCVLLLYEMIWVKEIALVLGWEERDVLSFMEKGYLDLNDFRSVVYFIEVYRERRGEMDAADYLTRKYNERQNKDND